MKHTIQNKVFWHHNRAGVKGTAVFVIAAFLSSTIAWSAPPVSAVPQETVSVPSTSDIHIPEEFGVVEEVYQAPNSSGNSPMVIYIQDAHCIYEAQTNIRKMIDKVQKDHDLKLVAVEGGEGKIDPTLFRTFPIQDVKEKVIDRYVQRGELSGADYAAIVNERESDFYGIEDMDLYYENKDAFLKAIDEKKRVDMKFDDIDRALRKMKEDVYSPELKELFGKTEDYEKERLSLIDYVKYFKGYGGITGNYPMISALLGAVEREQSLDVKKADEEVELLKRDIERALKTSNSDELKDFQEKYGAYKLGKAKREGFIPWLLSKAKGAGVLDEANTPALTEYTHHVAEMEKIKGEALFKEIDLMTREIKEKLFQNEEQKKLDQFFHNLKLLRNLSKLELSREELAEYRANQSDFSEKKFWDFIGRVPGLMELDKMFDPHHGFYEAALKRDQALHQNLMKLLNERNRKFAMVITGGFHSNGIKEMLKRDGISYMLIVPRITQFDEKTPYWDVMQGKVSYARFAKNETLAPEQAMNKPAFQQGASEALVESSGKGVLTKWKISAGQKWAKFIDSIFGGSAVPTIKDSLQRFVAAVRAAVLGKVNELENQPDISVENASDELTKAFPGLPAETFEVSKAEEAVNAASLGAEVLAKIQIEGPYVYNMQLAAFVSMGEMKPFSLDERTFTDFISDLEKNSITPAELQNFKKEVKDFANTADPKFSEKAQIIAGIFSKRFNFDILTVPVISKGWFTKTKEFSEENKENVMGAGIILDKAAFAFDRARKVSAPAVPAPARMEITQADIDQTVRDLRSRVLKALGSGKSTEGADVDGAMDLIRGYRSSVTSDAKISVLTNYIRIYREYLDAIDSDKNLADKYFAFDTAERDLNQSITGLRRDADLSQLNLRLNALRRNAVDSIRSFPVTTKDSSLTNTGQLTSYFGREFIAKGMSPKDVEIYIRNSVSVDKAFVLDQAEKKRFNVIQPVMTEIIAKKLDRNYTQEKNLEAILNFTAIEMRASGASLGAQAVAERGVRLSADDLLMIGDIFQDPKERWAQELETAAEQLGQPAIRNMKPNSIQAAMVRQVQDWADKARDDIDGLGNPYYAQTAVKTYLENKDRLAKALQFLSMMTDSPENYLKAKKAVDSLIQYQEAYHNVVARDYTDDGTITQSLFERAINYQFKSARAKPGEMPAEIDLALLTLPVGRANSLKGIEMGNRLKARMMEEVKKITGSGKYESDLKMQNVEGSSQAYSGTRMMILGLNPDQLNKQILPAFERIKQELKKEFGLTDKEVDSLKISGGHTQIGGEKIQDEIRDLDNKQLGAQAAELLEKHIEQKLKEVTARAEVQEKFLKASGIFYDAQMNKPPPGVTTMQLVEALLKGENKYVPPNNFFTGRLPRPSHDIGRITGHEAIPSKGVEGEGLKFIKQQLQSSVDSLRTNPEASKKALDLAQKDFSKTSARLDLLTVKSWKDVRYDRSYKLSVMQKVIGADANGSLDALLARLSEAAENPDLKSEQAQFKQVLQTTRKGFYMTKMGDEIGLAYNVDGKMKLADFSEFDGFNAMMDLYSPDNRDSIYHSILESLHILARQNGVQNGVTSKRNQMFLAQIPEAIANTVVIFDQEIPLKAADGSEIVVMVTRNGKRVATSTIQPGDRAQVGDLYFQPTAKQKDGPRTPLFKDKNTGQIFAVRNFSNLSDANQKRLEPYLTPTGSTQTSDTATNLVDSKGRVIDIKAQFEKMGKTNGLQKKIPALRGGVTEAGDVQSIYEREEAKVVAAKKALPVVQRGVQFQLAADRINAEKDMALTSKSEKAFSQNTIEKLKELLAAGRIDAIKKSAQPLLKGDVGSRTNDRKFNEFLTALKKIAAVDIAKETASSLTYRDIFETERGYITEDLTADQVTSQIRDRVVRAIRSEIPSDVSLESLEILKAIPAAPQTVTGASLGAQEQFASVINLNEELLDDQMSPQVKMEDGTVVNLNYVRQVEAKSGGANWTIPIQGWGDFQSFAFIFGIEMGTPMVLIYDKEAVVKPASPIMEGKISKTFYLTPEILNPLRSPQVRMPDGSVVNFNYVKTISFLFRGQSKKFSVGELGTGNFQTYLDNHQIRAGDPITITYDENAVVKAPPIASVPAGFYPANNSVILFKAEEILSAALRSPDGNKLASRISMKTSPDGAAKMIFIGNSTLQVPTSEEDNYPPMASGDAFQGTSEDGQRVLLKINGQLFTVDKNANVQPVRGASLGAGIVELKIAGDISMLDLNNLNIALFDQQEALMMDNMTKMRPLAPGDEGRKGLMKQIADIAAIPVRGSPYSIGRGYSDDFVKTLMEGADEKVLGFAKEQGLQLKTNKDGSTYGVGHGLAHLLKHGEEFTDYGGIASVLAGETKDFPKLASLNSRGMKFDIYQLETSDKGEDIFAVSIADPKGNLITTYTVKGGAAIDSGRKALINSIEDILKNGDAAYYAPANPKEADQNGIQTRYVELIKGELFAVYERQGNSLYVRIQRAQDHPEIMENISGKYKAADYKAFSALKKDVVSQNVNLLDLIPAAQQTPFQKVLKSIYDKAFRDYPIEYGLKQRLKTQTEGVRRFTADKELIRLLKLFNDYLDGLVSEGKITADQQEQLLRGAMLNDIGKKDFVALQVQIPQDFRSYGANQEPLPDSDLMLSAPLYETSDETVLVPINAPRINEQGKASGKARFSVGAGNVLLHDKKPVFFKGHPVMADFVSDQKQAAAFDVDGVPVPLQTKDGRFVRFSVETNLTSESKKITGVKLGKETVSRANLAATDKKMLDRLNALVLEDGSEIKIDRKAMNIKDTAAYLASLPEVQTISNNDLGMPQSAIVTDSSGKSVYTFSDQSKSAVKIDFNLGTVKGTKLDERLEKLDNFSKAAGKTESPETRSIVGSQKAFMDMANVFDKPAANTGDRNSRETAYKNALKLSQDFNVPFDVLLNFVIFKMSAGGGFTEKGEEITELAEEQKLQKLGALRDEILKYHEEKRSVEKSRIEPLLNAQEIMALGFKGAQIGKIRGDLIAAQKAGTVTDKLSAENFARGQLSGVEVRAASLGVADREAASKALTENDKGRLSGRLMRDNAYFLNRYHPETVELMALMGLKALVEDKPIFMMDSDFSDPSYEPKVREKLTGWGLSTEVINAVVEKFKSGNLDHHGKGNLENVRKQFPALGEDAVTLDIVLEKLRMEPGAFQNSLLLVDHVDGDSIFPLVAINNPNLFLENKTVRDMTVQASNFSEKPEGSKELFEQRLAGNLQQTQKILSSFNALVRPAFDRSIKDESVRSQRLAQALDRLSLAISEIATGEVSDETRKLYEPEFESLRKQFDLLATKGNEILERSDRGKVTKIDYKQGLTDAQLKYSFNYRGSVVVLNYKDNGDGTMEFNPVGLDKNNGNIDLSLLPKVFAQMELEKYGGNLPPEAGKNWGGSAVAFGSPSKSLLKLDQVTQMVDLFVLQETGQLNVTELTQAEQEALAELANRSIRILESQKLDNKQQQQLDRFKQTQKQLEARAASLGMVTIEQLQNAANFGLEVKMDSAVESWLLNAIEKSENLEPGVLKRTKEERRGPGYHLTIIPPTESKVMKENPAGVLEALNKLLLPKLAEADAIPIAGVGKNYSEKADKKSYFLVVDLSRIPELKEFRQTLGLDNYDLHITLGFVGNDVFPKKPQTGFKTVSPELTAALSAAGVTVSDSLPIGALEIPPREAARGASLGAFEKIKMATILSLGLMLPGHVPQTALDRQGLSSPAAALQPEQISIDALTDRSRWTESEYNQLITDWGEAGKILAERYPNFEAFRQGQQITPEEKSMINAAIQLARSLDPERANRLFGEGRHILVDEVPDWIQAAANSRANTILVNSRHLAQLAGMGRDEMVKGWLLSLTHELRHIANSRDAEFLNRYAQLRNQLGVPEEQYDFRLQALDEESAYAETAYWMEQLGGYTQGEIAIQKFLADHIKDKNYSGPVAGFVTGQINPATGQQYTINEILPENLRAEVRQFSAREAMAGILQRRGINIEIDVNKIEMVQPDEMQNYGMQGIGFKYLVAVQGQEPFTLVIDTAGNFSIVAGRSLGVQAPIDERKAYFDAVRKNVNKFFDDAENKINNASEQFEQMANQKDFKGFNPDNVLPVMNQLGIPVRGNLSQLVADLNQTRAVSAAQVGVGAVAVPLAVEAADLDTMLLAEAGATPADFAAMRSEALKTIFGPALERLRKFREAIGPKPESAINQYDEKTFEFRSQNMPELLDEIKTIGPSGKVVIHLNPENVDAINDILEKLMEQNEGNDAVIMSKIKKVVRPEIREGDIAEFIRKANRLGGGILFLTPEHPEIVKEAKIGNKLAVDVTSLEKVKEAAEFFNEFVETLKIIPPGKDGDALRKQLENEFSDLGIKQTDGYFTVDLNALFKRVTSEFKAVMKARVAA